MSCQSPANAGPRPSFRDALCSRMLHSAASMGASTSGEVEKGTTVEQPADRCLVGEVLGQVLGFDEPADDASKAQHQPVVPDRVVRPSLGLRVDQRGRIVRRAGGAYLMPTTIESG